jgi:predicted TIM-barrel fold metal-dependent hydrolase
MIIDSHCHLIGEGWMHRNLSLGIGRMAAAVISNATGDSPDPEALMDTLMPLYCDATGEKLVASMDKAGVDTTCVFAVDFGLCTGEPDVPITEQNRLIAEAAANFPQRLVPFFAIDPRRAGAPEMLQRAIEQWGIRGLKLHPTTGYFPHDPAAYPLYERCLEYGIPVLFHTGSTCGPMKSRFAQPIHMDDVAADFPDLSIIMAHAGLEMWEEALIVARVKSNVSFDISGWQAIWANRPQAFYRMLRTLLNEVGPWRVFFGSDGPFLDLSCPLDRWVRAFTEPDLTSCPDISFSQEEMEIVTGRAFARLLGMG